MNVLAQAARNLPGHWLKGNYGDGGGNYCMVGHVLRAMEYSEEEVVAGDADNDSPTNHSVFNIVKEVLEEYAPGWEFIAHFNDAEETTEADVVAVLEKAAAKLDEKVQ